jgi:hypothetical protein
MESQARKDDINVMPWHIQASPEEDGLTRDCVLVAVMNGNEMQTVSLHLAWKSESPLA